MKKCTRCNTVKPLSDFQKRKASNDGLTASCKICLAAYDKSRDSLPHRLKLKRDYQRTESGKEKHYQANHRYRKSQPERNLARQKVKRALESGLLVRHPCFTCGNVDVEGHHYDYSRPLDVIWLCDRHHKDVHNLAKQINKKLEIK